MKINSMRDVYKGRQGERLRNAATNGDDEAILILVDRGTDVNTKDNYGYTPLHFAAGYSNVGAVKMLVNLGADVNAKNVYGSTPLEWATVSNCVEAVKVLLKQGADVNAKNVYGRTALDAAEQIKYPFASRAEAIKVLREFGAKD